MSAHAVADEDQNSLPAPFRLKTGYRPSEAFLEVGVPERQLVFQFLDGGLDFFRLRRSEVFG
jgi:hypothetical protein